MKKRAHITLDDIARRLKVSRVTVSKALRGHPDISAETTRRVTETAAKLGYTPNIIARSLSARRSNMIGVVLPKIAHSFFSSLIESAYNTAFERNIEVILTISQENPERERKHLQTLVAMRVDGIIVSITQSTTDLEQFTRIRELGIPMVFVDRSPEPPIDGISTVLCDDRGGAYQATEQAISVGYRKIGLIGGNPAVSIGSQRRGGFEDALRAHRLAVNPAWILEGGYAHADGYEGLRHLHAAGTMPEAVLAMTYPVALGIMEAARELGLRIPEDIDLICFGDPDAGRFLSPALSVVKQPAAELGTRAVQILLENIAHPDVTREHHVILPTQLVLRDTCVRGPAEARG